MQAIMHHSKIRRSKKQQKSHSTRKEVAASIRAEVARDGRLSRASGSSSSSQRICQASLQVDRTTTSLDRTGDKASKDTSSISTVSTTSNNTAQCKAIKVTILINSSTLRSTNTPNLAMDSSIIKAPTMVEERVATNSPTLRMGISSPTGTDILPQVTTQTNNIREGATQAMRVTRTVNTRTSEYSEAQSNE